MRLFQSTLESFAILGITLDQSVQKNPLNARILAAFSTFTLRIVLYTVFFFHDASTISEYTENLWLNSAATLVLIGFAVEVFKMDKIFALIDNCVTISAESEQAQNNTLNNIISNGKFEKTASGYKNPKSKAIYYRANQRIDKTNGTIFTVVVKMNPFLAIFPKFIACLIVYFTTNMSNEVLKLPLPMWYVCYKTSLKLVKLN